MLSLALDMALLVAQTFGWLVVILPFFELLHLRLFRTTKGTSQATFQLSNWYLNFFKALSQAPANDPPRFIRYSRKSLLFVLLALAVFGISTLPLSSTFQITGQSYFADNGSEIFSVYFILGFLLSLSIVYQLLGFTLDKPLVSLSSVEKSATRQAVLVAIIIAVATTPFIALNTPMRALVELQVTPLIGALPAWGAFVNPVAFVCVCVAVAIYVRQWQEDEFPPPSILRKSLEGELLGTELVAYRVSRSIEYALLYSLVVTAFLGGPYLGDLTLHPLFALLLFTAKVFGFAVIVLMINFFLPQMQQNQSLRVIFLALLPMELVAYPISLALCELLNFR